VTEPESNWHLYMIRCGDNSLYTGVTTDVERRFAEHQQTSASSKGAKFLRGKQPLTLVYRAELGNRAEAQQLEYRLKQLSKSEKENLVRQQPRADKLREQLQSNE